MSKVVIFYPHIGEYGGIERNIIALAAEINNKGLEAALVCFYDSIHMPGYHHGLKTIVLGDHWNPFVKALRLRRWMSKNSSDLAGLPLFFGTKAGFYAGLASISKYALHYTDPPSLLTARTFKGGITRFISGLRYRFSNWLVKRGVVRATRLITMTHWNADELTLLYNKQFDVVYQGGVPPVGRVVNAYRCKGPFLRLFSICRLHSSKNLDWILSTASHLMAFTPVNHLYQKIEVTIAGTGPEAESLKKRTVELGLEEIIKFPGFLTAAQVEEEYRKSDLFLVPGRQGFGLPVLEALYRRVPVVVNKESRISEMLNENRWVAISENSSDSFSNEVTKHILHLRNKYPDESQLQNLPTEQGWALAIGEKCKWWQK